MLPGAATVCRTFPTRIPDTLFHRLDHGLATVDVAPFSKSVENVVSGLCERVYFTDDAGTQKPACERRCSDLQEDTEALVRIIGPCNRETGAEFLASRTGSKRKMYEQARQDLMGRPRTLRELARLAFFTKFESTMHVKKQVPRIISPRSFGYNYLLGRYIRPVEHKIFDALQELGGYEDPVIAKGLTQQAKAQLIVNKLRPGWVCVGLDASRFDQCVGAELLKAEHAVYNGLFGDRLLRMVLKEQLHNTGVAHCYDGVVKANIGPMRCSGDQNTSLGNCLISVLLARLFCKENDLITHDLLCDGDDLLLFVPASSLPSLQSLTAWYLRWGMRMKVEPPASAPEQVEFCQSRPVELSTGWNLVRNPRKVLNADFCHGPKVAKYEQFLVHLRAVGLCGMSMAGGVPVLQALYMKAIELGRTGRWVKEELRGIGYQASIQWKAGYRSVAAPITESARQSFRLAFGIEPAEQELLERHIAECGATCRRDDNHHQAILLSEDFGYLY